MTNAYVYLQSEKPCPDNDYQPLWTVGFYDYTGAFIAESDHNDRALAAQRVHWLNGGKVD